jgi:hypothetical protein
MRNLVIALALALLLAACGGGDEADTAVAAPETAAAEEAMDEETMDEDEAMDEETMDEDEAMDEEAMDDGAHEPTTFTVTITNTSETANLATPLAPGAYVVHTSMETLFAEGTLDRDEGLEALAEDGDPSQLTTTLGSLPSVSDAGVFTNPDGGSEAGVALPGSSYSFTFEAEPGAYLSFATMFVQSNDWFFAPSSSGIDLFDGDSPLEGDITDLVGLWDAGTEVDETPGEGANQAPRQTGPDTGPDQDAPIVAVAGYDGTIAVTINAG